MASSEDTPLSQPSSYQDGQSARIYAFIARDEPIGVVLRRGPSKHTLMLRWNMETDTFEEGQWFVGRIYERRCDLSPCGKHFVYFGAKHRGEYYAYTVVSPPPYYSAHILWPKIDCWGGGGLFDPAKKVLQLNHPTEFDMKTKTRAKDFDKDHGKPAFGKLPAPYKTWEPLGDYSGSGEDLPIEHARMTRDGWKFENKDLEASLPRKHVAAPDEDGVFFNWKTKGAYHWVKTAMDGRELTLIQDQAGQIDGRWNIITCHLKTTKGKLVDYQRVDWADFDKNGDLLFARNGRLYRVKPGKEDAPRCLIDLNDRKFRNVLPPEGMARKGRSNSNAETDGETPPADTGWHPLNKE